MATTRFSLGELPRLDLGRVKEQFDREMDAAVCDIMERPGVEGARIVRLELRIEPETLSGGANPHIETVLASFRISVKAPVKASRAYSMLVGPKGKLIFNHESPDDPRQATIDDEMKRKDEKGGAD